MIADSTWDKSFKKFLNERAKSIFNLIQKFAIQPMDEMNKKFGIQSSCPLHNLKDLILEGRVKANDLVYTSKFPDKTAKILDHKSVEYEGQKVSINDWAKQVLGVSRINIYSDVYLKRDNSSLGSLRQR
jgi:hypothetical protein